MRLGLLSVLLAALPAFARQDSYAPSIEACPSNDQLFRFATNGTLSPAEETYIDARLEKTLPLWQSYAARTSLYNISASPRLAIAFSGGSFRSALFGAGLLNVRLSYAPDPDREQALDDRNASSSIRGPLQGAAYIAGVSGGAWLVGSYAVNGPKPIYQLILGSSDSSGWQLDRALLLPSDDEALNEAYYQSIQRDVALKDDVLPGQTSIADHYGRTLAHHFANSSTDGFYNWTASGQSAGLLWSDVLATDAFASHDIALPIIVADSDPPPSFDRLLGPTLPKQSTPLGSVVYEFSPFESGSFDPQLAAFVNTSYLFTELRDGSPINRTRCIRGGDNFPWLLATTAGTLSDSLQEYMEGKNDSALPTGALRFFDEYKAFNETYPSASSFSSILSNPFEFSSRSEYEDASSSRLSLLDGSDDGQDFPLESLLVPARKIDVIIAADAASNTKDNFPNGSSIAATARKAALYNISLPPIPSSADDFVKHGLNKRPTFFGCSSNSSSTDSLPYPLIVYLPNTALRSEQPVTNTTLFKYQYSRAETTAFLDQATELVSQGIVSEDGSADSRWPTCLACALLERQRARQGLPLASACVDCFARYCW